MITTLTKSNLANRPSSHPTLQAVSLAFMTVCGGIVNFRSKYRVIEDYSEKNLYKKEPPKRAEMGTHAWVPTKIIEPPERLLAPLR